MFTDTTELINFLDLESIELLCLHLQCSPDALQRFVKAEEHGIYRPIHIRKRGNRGIRLVYDVSRDLRRVHRTIARTLRSYLNDLPDCVHGFRRDRSIVTNAKAHCNQDAVLTLDIADFYGSIDTWKVYDLFTQLSCPQTTAVTLARICTFKGALPQGGRASPSIANLVCKEMDVELSQLCSNYTRYADDLTFSGSSLPSTEAIQQILSRYGFKIRQDSEKRQMRGRGQVVTGLSVDNTSYPRLTRRIRREIEATLYFAKKYGMSDHLSWQRGCSVDAVAADRKLKKLRGRIHSFAPVEPRAGQWIEDVDSISI